MVPGLFLAPDVPALARCLRADRIIARTTSLRFSNAFQAVNVAAYIPGRCKLTGQSFGGCLWTEGLPSLLPRSDRIALCREADLPAAPRPGSPLEVVPPVLVSWEDAIELAGGLLTPMGLYPERYEVAGFPDAEQLQALRARDRAEEMTGRQR